MVNFVQALLDKFGDGLRFVLAVILVFLACVGATAWAEESSEFEGFLLEQAERGGAQERAVLGFAYYHGEKVPQDYAKAAKWLLDAAGQGHVVSQYYLGVMYSNGQGVAQDYAKAAEWYRRAADGGQARSQFNLGLMYGFGIGVVQDYTESAKWHHRAADQGFARVCRIARCPWCDVYARSGCSERLHESRKMGWSRSRTRSPPIAIHTRHVIWRWEGCSEKLDRSVYLDVSCRGERVGKGGRISRFGRKIIVFR